MEYLYGIDLGGTKIEGAVITSGKHEIIARMRIPTEADQGYLHILNRIMTMIRMLMKETKTSPQSIGIGTPGSIDPLNGTIKNSNTTCLNGTTLKTDLEQNAKIPFVLANDANCFALAESSMGVVVDKVPNTKSVFGIILGTGVGGGIIINGKILVGRHGLGGEWGHNFLDESGGKCYCGKSGCVETILSGPALQKFYASSAKQQLSLPKIVEESLKGNAAAVETIKRLNFFFGKAISQVVNIIDPDAIVVGGGVGNISSIYTEGKKYAEQFIFNPWFSTPILQPKLGDSAGVIGAALLTENYCSSETKWPQPD